MLVHHIDFDDKEQETDKTMIKILIVDDSRLFRERIRAFLAASPDIVVVGEAEDGQEVLGKARELQPDVMLMDVKMGRVSGLTATGLLKRELPHIQVIILSLYDLEAYREAAESMGASAYVSKRHLADELLPAIRRAVQTNQSAPAPTGLRRQTLAMNDKDKTRVSLENELKELRQRVAELEASQAEWMRVERTLRESERRYRLLAENATDVIWTMDLSLKSTYTSPSVQQLRGYSVDDAVAQPLEDALTPASFEVVTKALDEELALEARPDKDLFRSRTLELEVIRKDGSTVWVESTVTFLRDPDGGAVEILGVNRDITERRRAEQALSTNQARLSTIINSARDAIISLDADQRIVVFNPAAEQLFRCPADQVIGQTLDRFIPERFREAHRERIRHFGQTKQTNRSMGVLDPLTCLRADGEEFPAEITISQTEMAGQKIYTAILRDVTKRMRAETDLRLQSAALEAVANSVVITDRHGIIQWANPAFTKLTGYTIAEAVGKNPRDLLRSGKQDRAFYKNLWDTILAGQVWRGELINRRKDGTYYTEEMTLTPLQDERGQVIRFIAVKQDVTERKRSEMEITRLLEESQQRLKQVEALHSIDLAISGSMDLRTTLNVLLKHVESLLTIDAADILLFNPNLRQFSFSAGRGFLTNSMERASVRLNASLAGRAALQRRAVVVSGTLANQADPEFARIYEREGFIAYVGVPLVAKGQIKGVLEVYHRSVHEPEPEWLNLLETLAGQAAIAIDNAQLFDSLQQSNIELVLAYDATITGWSRAMDLRDKETEGHTQRVTDLTLRLARAMDVSEARLIPIRHGALLHDIGKMGVPDNILLKADKLTDEEWKEMRKHPEFAYEMLSSIRYLQPALDIPYCHHERWDGSGYPRGLKGEEIPIAARIFAVADVWDAITNDRPYRKGWSKEDALEHIRDQSGKYFDPEVVEAFLKIVNLDSYDPGP
jgi:PAS domain S-box-containing protein